MQLRLRGSVGPKEWGKFLKDAIDMGDNEPLVLGEGWLSGPACLCPRDAGIGVQWTSGFPPAPSGSAV